VPGHEWPPLNTVSEREEKERYKREKNSVKGRPAGMIGYDNDHMVDYEAF
jgi:hypothetical protein